MAKRAGENVSSTSKKQKLDQDCTFWDDDLDDDCFNSIATKILEQDVADIPPSQANDSILPSYDVFRPNITFASTQNTFTPTFSKLQAHDKKNHENLEDLKLKVAYLQQKCEAKEGEVSILRSQMHKMKSEVSEEQNKRQKEFLESTNAKEKELKSIQGQLEFKNLEIANLKEKISNMSKPSLSKVILDDNIKRSRIDSSSKNIRALTSKDSPLKTKKNKCIDETDIEIIIMQQLEFPLSSKFSSELFENLLREVHVVETRVNQHGKNTIPYLHNQMMQQKLSIPPGPKVTVKIGKEEVSLEYIYPEIFKITQCNSLEINNEKIEPLINKVLAMSIQLLQYFNQYLELLENSCNIEENEQSDRKFLRSNSIVDKVELHDLKCQVGVRAGKTVQFVAELLPYSAYLADYLVFHKAIQFDEDLLQTFTFLREAKEKDYYLQLLNNIMKKIATLKKANVCHCFLNAVATLLGSLSRNNFYNNVFPIFSTLIGSLLYTRPPMTLLHKLLVVFKNCSTSTEFVQFLCLKLRQNSTTVDVRRKSCPIDESCKFTFFVALLNCKLQDVQDEEKSLDITLNVLSFIHNIFVMNPSWMHNSQKDECVCLRQLYELAVEVLYKILKQFNVNRNSLLGEMYVLIFKCGIKIFELLSFNSFDLVEKSMENLSRYREICNSLAEIQENLFSAEEISSMQKLNIFEDVPSVPSAKFDLL